MPSLENNIEINPADKVKPYKELKSGKKQQVADMFNNISHRYDFLNHFLSLGIDILWRKKAVRLLKPFAPKIILDIATGTGDFAIECLSLNPHKIVGIDISDGMLEVGRQKLKKKAINDKIELKNGDSENINFDNEYFDAITVAFGVRNFEHLEVGLKEMSRVLKPGGVAAILEFSKPTIFPLKQLYNFYFLKVLPSLGKKISSDSSAYTYLPESVQAFPDGIKMANIIKSCGFNDVKIYTLTGGIATIYLSTKK
jgi:demethylmenaquinone methyltransferase/2-methoxy-6-polyprenyl-1,4-benzoquinol methylase